MTLLITGLNYVGVRRAGEFQLAFTVLKVALIVVIALLAFTAASGSWSNFSTRYIGAKGGIAGFMAALVAALWAYDGWNDLNLVGGEISRPEKNIPVALIAGVGVVAILYMGMNAAVQFALSAAKIAQSSVPASSAIAGLSWGAALVSVGMVVSMVVGLNGTTMSGGRVPFAVARDGYFPKSLAEVHPRFHTPGMALVVQAILAIVLIVVGGTFKELLSLAISAEWFFYMLAASTIFKFRWKDPDRPRPYRAWGYPVVPALFIAAAGVLLYYTFMDRPRMAVWCLLVNLAGIPVYLYFAGRAASDSVQRSDA